MINSNIQQNIHQQHPNQNISSLPLSSLQNNQQNIMTMQQQQQQKKMLENFMKKPYSFISPPMFSDITLTQYRQNLSQIQAITQTYEIFNQRYYLKNGQRYVQVPKNLQQNMLDIGNNKQKQKQKQKDHKMQQNIEQNANVFKKQKTKQKITKGFKMQIFNFKFMGYTLYASMIQTLKLLKIQGITNQRLKSQQSILKRKLQQFYNQANQTKQKYRRLQAIHLIQKQSQYLKQQTVKIKETINNIEDYVDSKIRMEEMMPQS